MPDLSPAAQAVMAAYYCGAPLTGRDRVAAALRAAAHELKYVGITEKNILAIAAELDNTSPPS